MYQCAEGIRGRLQEELFLRYPTDRIFTVHDLLWEDGAAGTLFEQYRLFPERLHSLLRREEQDGLLERVRQQGPLRFMLSKRGREQWHAFHQHRKITRDEPRLALLHKVALLDRARIAYAVLGGRNFRLSEPFAQHAAGFSNQTSMRTWLYRLQGVCFSLTPDDGDIKVRWLAKAVPLLTVSYVHPDSHRARDGRLGGLFVNVFNVYQLCRIAYELKDMATWWVRGTDLIPAIQERFGLQDKRALDIGAALRRTCNGGRAVLEYATYTERLSRRKRSDTHVERALYRITPLGLCLASHWW